MARDDGIGPDTGSQGDGPTSSGASVYQRLRDEILSCELRPGTSFQERQLAERFNVSKSPVRDALIKLQEQNLVEVMPRKGYRVTRVSLSDARDLYEMRHILEREAVLRLIDSGPDELLAALDQFREGPAEGSRTEWIAYNRGFHCFILANCGNARLARSGIETVEQFDRMTHVSVAYNARPRLADRLAEHGAIIDAIQARDKRRAAALTRDHIEGSCQRLLQALENASVVP